MPANRNEMKFGGFWDWFEWLWGEMVWCDDWEMNKSVIGKMKDKF